MCYGVKRRSERESERGKSGGPRLVPFLVFSEGEGQLYTYPSAGKGFRCHVAFQRLSARMHEYEVKSSLASATIQSNRCGTTRAEVALKAPLP